MLRVLCFVCLLAATARAATVTLIAGGGTGGDGSKATEAKLNEPFALDFDKAGNIYFAEMGGNRVRKVDTNGILTTIAGTGEKGNSGDGGPAIKAQLNGPHHLMFLRDNI